MGTDVPKQYLEVNGLPVVSYCLNTFLADSVIDALVVVVADEWKAFIVSQIERMETSKPVCYAQPGATRQYSIFNGLLTAMT